MPNSPDTQTGMQGRSEKLLANKVVTLGDQSESQMSEVVGGNSNPKHTA